MSASAWGSLAGGVLGAAGTLINARNAGKNALEQQAFLSQSADYDLMIGRLRGQDIDTQAGDVLAAQKVSYAGQGVDLSSESVSQVREETLAQAAQMKNEAELDAAMTAWGKKEQGRQGVVEARRAQRGARISAAGQVIGAAANFI